jgi:hypothetical protein
MKILVKIAFAVILQLLAGKLAAQDFIIHKNGF